jgi:hypothetical protein
MEVRSYEGLTFTTLLKAGPVLYGFHFRQVPYYGGIALCFTQVPFYEAFVLLPFRQNSDLAARFPL